MDRNGGASVGMASPRRLRQVRRVSPASESFCATVNPGRFLAVHCRAPTQRSCKPGGLHGNGLPGSPPLHYKIRRNARPSNRRLHGTVSRRGGGRRGSIHLTPPRKRPERPVRNLVLVPSSRKTQGVGCITHPVGAGSASSPRTALPPRFLGRRGFREDKTVGEILDSSRQRRPLESNLWFSLGRIR